MRFLFYAIRPIKVMVQFNYSAECKFIFRIARHIACYCYWHGFEAFMSNYAPYQPSPFCSNYHVYVYSHPSFTQVCDVTAEMYLV